MAAYRHIHIDYWQDSFVLDLTPEEKYFYIYLMTNSKTTQCGDYRNGNGIQQRNCRKAYTKIYRIQKDILL